MKQRAEELSEAIEGLLGTRGYELVELKVVPQGRSLCLRILIDHAAGAGAVTIGDCIKVSKALGADLALDGLLPERHVLEVSSPGVNRPLTKPAHFRRFAGEQAVIRFDTAAAGRRTVTGVIAAADDEAVTIVDGGGERIEIPLTDILSAHLKVDPWKPIEKR
jgi:ribosome maturation factor RimP